MFQKAVFLVQQRLLDFFLLESLLACQEGPVTIKMVSLEEAKRRLSHHGGWNPKMERCLGQRGLLSFMFWLVLKGEWGSGSHSNLDAIHIYTLT